MVDDGYAPESSAPQSSSFLGLRRVSMESCDSEDVVFFGVPSDMGADARTGATLGPDSIRRASWTFGSYSQALGLDVTEELSLKDGGDISDLSGSREEVLKRVQATVFELSRGGQIPALVGGNQSLTLAALRGILQAKRRPVGLLHLTPSHRMLRASAGEAGMLFRAAEEKLIRPKSVLQVGVRSGGARGDESQEAFRAGFERLSMDDVRWDIHGSMETVRSMANGSALYVSVDLSVFDPSVCPGVTRPIPGGLTSWEGQQVIRSLVGAEIVGFDAVGLCPAFDVSDLTSSVAVDVLHEILAAVASTRTGARASASQGRMGRTSA